MTLFDQWRDLIDNQTEASFQEFWAKYSGAETRIYTDILENKEAKMNGTLSELAAKYETEPVIFMGFLDGVNSSLLQELALETMDESSAVAFELNFETLYFNMLKANADYLYGISAWDTILSDEKKQEITAAYKRSRTIVKDKEPGRNDPCPCGSGKKYKKCCGIATAN